MFTVEDVLKAYEATGTLPIARSWGSADRNCLCPTMALVATRGVVERAWRILAFTDANDISPMLDVLAALADLDLGIMELVSFTEAYDGMFPPGYTSDLMTPAHRLGIAVRAAVAERWPEVFPGERGDG